jgi:hypothetical protein
VRSGWASSVRSVSTVLVRAETTPHRCTIDTQYIYSSPRVIK